MRSRLTRNTNLACLSCGDDGNRDEQEVPGHPEGNDNDNYNDKENDNDKKKDKEYPSGANEQKKEDMDDTVMPVRCAPVTESQPPTIIKEGEDRFSQMVAMKLVNDQGTYSPLTFASLSDEDIAAICDVIRRPGCLVSKKMSDRGNHISILVENNLKVTVFMFKS